MLSFVTGPLLLPALRALSLCCVPPEAADLQTQGAVQVTSDTAVLLLCSGRLQALGETPGLQHNVPAGLNSDNQAVCVMRLVPELSGFQIQQAQ